MHEAMLMTGLMRRIAEIATEEGARRVSAVAVRLGALSHISAEHFAEHFRHPSDGTIAAGARLEVTVSTDAQRADAAEIRIESVEVESGP
jgi:hydrogenase nickel incorporation protein HypA/HybF